MKTRTAHLLRRTARKLIAWSNRLDAPRPAHIQHYDKYWNKIPAPVKAHYITVAHIAAETDR